MSTLEDKVKLAIGTALAIIPIQTGLLPDYGKLFKNRDSKEKLKVMAPQPNGKEICKKLREARIAFAKENGIDFHPAECHSDEPCPGTCPQCDKELEYLKAEAKKKNVVIYPQMEISSLGGK